MQVKNQDSRAAQASQTQAHQATDAHVKEASKTADAHKQAEAQQDAGKNWDKFANKAHAAPPPSLAQDKQVEASQEAVRVNIALEQRKNGIPA